MQDLYHQPQDPNWDLGASRHEGFSELGGHSFIEVAVLKFMRIDG